MGEGIVREAWHEYDMRVVIGHESQHIARATLPPAVAQGDATEEYIVFLEQRLYLLKVLWQIHT